MNTKTIELSGVLKFEWHSWNKIKLVQSDGYKIDLVGRFIEAVENFTNNKVQLNYWLSDKPCSKNEMVETFLKQFYGAIEAEYDKHEVRYSSWASDTDYDTTLSVGGHNLYNELADEQGRFIIIELNFQEAS